MEQKPSIGRIVRYRAYGTPGGEHKAELRAAIITEVFPDTPETGIVGLAILNPTGLFFNRSVAYDAEGRPGTWNWPARV